MPHNVVIVIATIMFMVLSSWHQNCESSTGSFDECSTSDRRPPTFGQSRLAWASDPPKLVAVVLHSPSPFITTQPKSWNRNQQQSYSTTQIRRSLPPVGHTVLQIALSPHILSNKKWVIHVSSYSENKNCIWNVLLWFHFVISWSERCFVSFGLA